MALINPSGKTEIKSVETISVKETEQPPVTEKVGGEKFLIARRERKIKSVSVSKKDGRGK